MATDVDDGGPAFACAGLSGLPNGDFLYGNNGMSLREYLAAHCPITFTEFLTGWKHTGWSTLDEALTRYAEIRLQYADGMLKARKS